jgi:hypothetical protein
MVEVIVAISIFALTLSGVAALLGTSLRIVGSSRGRSVAANLASQEMDLVRSTEFTELPLGMVQTTQDVDGTEYTVRRETEWVNQNASTGPCDAPAGSTLSFLRVSVAVSWAGMGATPPPESQTILSPPVGTYDEDSGHVAVSVVDRDGNPQSDVTVVADGPGTPETQVTTSEGCAFFPYQQAGAYEVTISATGYVDTVNASSAAQSLTVTNGTTTSAEFQFDAATTIQVDLEGTTGYPAAAGVPVTIANSHIVPAGVAVYPGTGATRSLPGLFPWADGYSVLAGACSHADPLAESAPGVRIWSEDAVRPAPIEAVPGGSSSATVRMSELEVEAMKDIGSGLEPAPGASVEVRQAPDDGCPSGESYVLGTTDASGIVGAGLPYGIWDVYVDGVLEGTATLDPTEDWSTPETLQVDLT